METKHVHKRITTNTTTNVTTKGAAVKQIKITVADPGTTWKLRIVDKAANPAYITPEFTLSAQNTPDAAKVFYDIPIPAENGIDIVTPSGTVGAVDVWIAFEQ